MWVNVQSSSAAWRSGVEGQQECLSGPCGWEASVGVVLSQLSPLVVDTPCCHVRHGEEM